MVAQPAVLLLCYQAAASAAKPALERCIEHAVAELQALETRTVKLAERDRLIYNWRFLQAHQADWPERYATGLLAEFTKRVPARLQLGTEAEARAESSGYGSFGLVDDAELKQKIEAQRMLQDLSLGTEQTLAELDALVSSALGLDHFAPDRNPLRPEIFSRTLRRLMAASLEDAEATALSIKYVAKPLGPELSLIYSQAIKALTQANIPAAAYQFRVQPSTQVPASPQPAGAGSQPGASSADDAGTSNPSSRQTALADLSNHGVKAGLLTDFLSNGGRGAEQGLAAPYYDNIDEELAAIKAASVNADALSGHPSSAALPFSASAQARLARIPAVDRPARTVNASSPLSEKIWGPYGTSRARTLVRTQLQKQATKVSQVLGLDVVRELVNQVAQDPRLLSPVRESIVALEPSLLRLAMVDPRFFSDERHAARQLMERVAQRSFKYNDEFSPEFSNFFQRLTESFNWLNASKVENAEPFRAALAALEKGWNAQDQEDFDRRQQVLQALRFAEERQEKADEIAFDLSARSDLEKVPGVVLDFLFGPWALVMANARLLDTRHQVDPHGFGSVVPDLVWSVKSEVTLKQPAKLIDMIPGLLEKLHSGLGLLGQAPKESEPFFESLMKLHRPVLKLRRLKSRRDALESGNLPLELEEETVSPAERLEKLRLQTGTQLWMGRSDLDAAGFEDTQPTQPAELTELVALTAADDGCREHAASIEADHDAAQIRLVHLPEAALALPADHQSEQAKELAAAVLSRLRTGCWIDLYSKRQWLRAQLTWASSHATLFMFISHGGQPHSMTKRSCEKLIAQRLLRPVDTQGVVAQALDAVTEAAAAQSRAVNAQAAQAGDRLETV